MDSLRDDSFDRPSGALGEGLAAHLDAIVRAAEREAVAAERAIAERRRRAEEEIHRYLASARLRVDAEAAARAARLETLSSATRRLADELADATAALNAELRRGERELDAAVPHAPWPASAPAGDTPPRPTWARTAPPGGNEAETAGVTRGAGAPAAAEHDVPIAAHGGVPAATDHDRPVTAGNDAPAATARGDASASHDGAPWAGERAATTIPSAARLVAIEMAVGGAARADVERQLRTRFGLLDPAPLLDDVFGPASTADSTLAWGEP